MRSSNDTMVSEYMTEIIFYRLYTMPLVSSPLNNGTTQHPRKRSRRFGGDDA